MLWERILEEKADACSLGWVELGIGEGWGEIIWLNIGETKLFSLNPSLKSEGWVEQK